MTTQVWGSHKAAPQPPFPPDACPVCGRPGQDGHFCDECVNEMERRGIDWEVMEPDEMREALRRKKTPNLDLGKDGPGKRA